MPKRPTIACPHCTKAYVLTAEYLEKYGGRDTNCSKCGKGFTLPATLDEVLPLPDRTAEFTDDGARKLEYATPGPSVSRGAPVAKDRYWREGDLLVMETTATLPDRCIKCNRPGTRQVPMTVSWSEGQRRTRSVYQLIFWFLTGNKAKIRVPLCSQHRIMRLSAVVIIVLFVPLSVIVGTRMRPTALANALACIMLIVVALLTWYVTRFLKPRYVDPRMVKLIGLSPEFIKSLPLKKALPRSTASGGVFDEIR